MSFCVRDTNYGWGPGNIGDATDIGNWYNWFRDTGSATTNDLNQATGNHHRIWNNAVQHKTDGDDDANPNVLEYPTGDDHPSAAGGQKASGEFLPLLNAAYHRWQAHP